MCPLHHSPPTLRRVLDVLLHVCRTRFARAQMAPRVCAMLAALRQTQAEVGNDASPGAFAWAQHCIKSVKLDVLPSAGVQCLAASLKKGRRLARSLRGSLSLILGSPRSASPYNLNVRYVLRAFSGLARRQLPWPGSPSQGPTHAVSTTSRT